MWGSVRDLAPTGVSLAILHIRVVVVVYGLSRLVVVLMVLVVVVMVVVVVLMMVIVVVVVAGAPGVRKRVLSLRSPAQSGATGNNALLNVLLNKSYP